MVHYILHILYLMGMVVLASSYMYSMRVYNRVAIGLFRHIMIDFSKHILDLIYLFTMNIKQVYFCFICRLLLPTGDSFCHVY